MITLINRILKVSGKYKRRIQVAFIFSFLKSMFSKAPICLAFVLFTLFLNDDMTASTCLIAGIALVACVLIQALLQNMSDRLQSTAGFMVFADKRKELGKHLRRMPMGYFTEGNIGKISSVLSTDMVFIEENCMMLLADIMSEVFSEIIMVIFLFTFNIYIGIVGALVCVVLILIGNGTVKAALKESDVRQQQSENLTSAVLDFAEGIGIIKTYNLIGKKSKELTDNFIKSRKTSLDFEEIYTPWARRINIALGIGSAIVVGMAMILYRNDMLTNSYLIGMMLFVFELFGPIKALYGNTARLTEMNSSMDRIEAVFNEQELPDTGRKMITETYEGPEIEFRNVSFSYGKKEVLHNIDFEVGKNQMCALVGPSGGGKSTVANVLARFWDVNRGQILIRGKEVRELPLYELMDHISMVFQRVYLFQDTIYNNICMGRPDASKSEVIEAAKKARCYDFIMSLPNGFDTMVGEGGESLSGGEKQRISIARCILKDAPIVILDEATASVDADNEKYIQEAISELCKGKTLIVIAHRLNTIREADKIIVIAEGKIVEKGTHDQLLLENGIYKKFVEGRQKATTWKLEHSK